MLTALRHSVYSSCLLFVLFTFLTPAAGQDQVAPQNPAAAPAQTDQPQTVPAQATPHVDSVVLFPQAAQGAQGSAPNPQSTYILEINGTGFESVDMKNIRVIVFPGTGVGPVTVLSLSLDKSKLFAQFTAPTNYVLVQVALSLTGTSFVTFNSGASSCDFGSKVVLTPQIVSNGQSKTKYGNGVAANFHVIQISMVNQCPMPLVVPLAGIRVVPAGINLSDKCNDSGNANLVPLSLDHVTSIYSANRRLTGGRAIFFNSLQALATLGSAIQPFFGPGFTQGVAILGGGFTTAAKEISVDMSTDQLQNITSQSFGPTEQISSGGSLQKFVFIPKTKGKACKDGILESNLRSGNFSVKYELTPASAEAPKAQVANATPTAPLVPSTPAAPVASGKAK